MLDELSGRTLGKYELVERVGRGGMAEVYKAYHAALDRYVALKVLHPFLGDDPEFKERFEREARNVARLKHPNIVQVYDFDFDSDRALYYMVMEYVEGITLRARLIPLVAQGNLLPLERTIFIARCVAEALAYAHQQGVVHRDVKPANVILEAGGRIVLTDFGIARIVSGPNVTASGSMVGTPTYMAPEQGLGHPGDRRSDIYSLGIMLYQLVTGVPPFDADTPVAVVLKHVNEPLPKPSAYNPDMPEALEQILYRALAKSPEERYQNAEELIADLDDLDATANAARPVHPAQATGDSASRASMVYMPSSGQAVAPKEHIRHGLRGSLVWLMLLLVIAGAALTGGYIGYLDLLPDYLPLIPNVAIELTSTPTQTITPTWDTSNGMTHNITGDRVLATEPAAPPAQSNTPGSPAMAALDCVYTYQVVGQDPENRARYPELTTLTLTLTLANTGQCALDDGTQLVFVDGFQMQGPNFYPFNRALAPGDRIEIVLNLRTPAFDPRTPLIRSTWAVIAGDGRQIGQALVFELELFPVSP